MTTDDDDDDDLRSALDPFMVAALTVLPDADLAGRAVGELRAFRATSGTFTSTSPWNANSGRWSCPSRRRTGGRGPTSSIPRPPGTGVVARRVRHRSQWASDRMADDVAALGRAISLE